MRNLRLRSFLQRFKRLNFLKISIKKMNEYNHSLILASLILFFVSCIAAAAEDQVSATEPFRWARVKGHYRWADHPTADSYLMEELKKQAAINVDSAWNAVEMSNLNEMVKYPALLISSPDDFIYTEAERLNLKEYVLRGGFILADDCVFKGYPPDKFTTSFKAMVKLTFNTEMVQIPLSDDIYHCFHDMEKVPVMQGKDTGGWGLYVKGRLAIFLDSGDIHCGWESRRLRETRMRPWFPYDNETLALKMGVNILIYMMSH